MEEIKNKQNIETEKFSSSSKFSISKLTKFVSRSALKVISSARKSVGSLSSNNSSDTSMNSEDNDNDEEEEELCKKNLNINLVKLMDDEERENVERSMNGVKRRPAMGLTAVMLKRLKSNNGSSYSTSYCAPNYFLVGLPIVFNSSNLKQEDSVFKPSQTQQKTNQAKAFTRNKTTSDLEHKSNTYDHLNRVKETPKKIQVNAGKMSVYSGNKSMSASNLKQGQTQVSTSQLQAHAFDSFVF